jgi:hypothetical protein
MRAQPAHAAQPGAGRHRHVRRCARLGRAAAGCRPARAEAAGRPRAWPMTRCLCRHADHGGRAAGLRPGRAGRARRARPRQPQAQQFVLDYMKDRRCTRWATRWACATTSVPRTAYTERRWPTPSSPAAHGTNGSVMEYAAGQPAAARRAGGGAFQAALGPTTTGPSNTPTSPCPAEQERRGTAAHRRAQRRAGAGLRHRRRQLPRHRPRNAALRPGRRPAGLRVQARFDIARDLFSARRPARCPDEDYAVLRRSHRLCAARRGGRAAGVLLRQIGGVRTLRDFPNSGRDPLQPLPAADQRAALDLSPAPCWRPTA